MQIRSAQRRGWRGGHENDDFPSYDDRATVSVGCGHQFIQTDRTALLTETSPGDRRARDSETGEVDNGLIARELVDVKHELTDNTDLVNTMLARPAATTPSCRTTSASAWR